MSEEQIPYNERTPSIQPSSDDIDTIPTSVAIERLDGLKARTSIGAALRLDGVTRDKSLTPVPVFLFDTTAARDPEPRVALKLEQQPREEVEVHRDVGVHAYHHIAWLVQPAQTNLKRFGDPRSARRSRVSTLLDYDYPGISKSKPRSDIQRFVCGSVIDDDPRRRNGRLASKAFS